MASPNNLTVTIDRLVQAGVPLVLAQILVQEIRKIAIEALTGSTVVSGDSIFNFETDFLTAFDTETTTVSFLTFETDFLTIS